ncbi:interleukin-6 receptor subunit beta [Acanthochromis polyacanthus]|uniref:interleukin-6 receptor subunit beta n=1 Tax=Acanthochromis polyacanthus TaxID=80966 RepID=UPI00223476A5|nr:interleukin-6 receptor subunit beta [Acanthochromis polyacanthus]
MFIVFFSSEVTVRNWELKRCEENAAVCVTDQRDCKRLVSAAAHKTLNMSCFYQKSSDGGPSVTCSWKQESNQNYKPDTSLVFTRRGRVSYCSGIFNPAAVLNVSVRMKNFQTGAEAWSWPHTMFLYEAVKPSRPSLALIGSSEDSLVVSVKSSSDGSCRLRYKANNAQQWTLLPDSISVGADRQLIFTIKHLQTFSVYRAAASCKLEVGFWSDWSDDISGKTLDRAPSKPPDVCYRLEKTNSNGSLLLFLMWKAPDPGDAGGRILGYQVSCDGSVQNVTGAMALLVVEEGNCSVAAFNTAGRSPATHLKVDRRRGDLPSIRNLWVSSSYPDEEALLVRWKLPISPSSVPPISYLNLRWSSESNPSTSRWSTVDAFSSSTLIKDVGSAESYLITVIPVYHHLCGRPQSLSADLKHGALLEVVGLKVAAVNKTTVTVKWAWQRRSGPIRVRRYSVMLRTDSDNQNVSLWPDQSRHTFFNLTPYTQYSLLLLADDVTRSIVPVTTDFDELPAVATATPLLLLAATVFIISILSRTVYKSYFFPPISSPRGSTSGQWLMDPNLQKSIDRNILEIEDFQVRDVLGDKSLITLNPNPLLPSEETHEDSPLPVQLSVQLSTLKLDSEYVSEAPQTSDQHRHEAHSRFNQKEEQLDVSKRHFDEFEAHQTSCEEEFLLNSEAQNEHGDGSYLICETDYVTNSCFRAMETTASAPRELRGKQGTAD